MASEPPPEPLTGACFCKALRFRLHPASKDDLRLTAYCHCSKCQTLNGAPYIWTTHWREGAVSWFTDDEAVQDDAHGAYGPPARAELPLLPNKPDLPPSMQTFNTMPGRKWKIRCRRCGNPCGSWNEAKRQWSLWPTTLDRPAPSQAGQADVGSVRDITAWFRPTHHMFYGEWRAVDAVDDLPAYVGYEADSERVK